MIKLKSEAEGIFSFRLGTFDASGNEVDCYDPVPPTRNLITNGGLERMAENADWLSYTYVGSGSAAPDFDDSAMNDLVASTASLQASTNGAQATAPYFTWVRITRRFAPAEATGNLSEVGVGWFDGLFSHALIVDADGNPTTITVGAEQFLDVTYEFRFYPKTTDDTGSFTLTGSLGGTYDYVYRAANVTQSNSVTGWEVDINGNDMGSFAPNPNGKQVLAGPIGPITSGPSGEFSIADSLTAVAYEASSLSRKATMALGLDVGNFDTGIKSALFKGGIGTFQVEFDPAIMKTDQRLLNLEFSHSWGRRA